MHILYYFWNENSAADIEDSFAALGHQCMRFSMPLKNQDHDLEFELQITDTRYLLSAACMSRSDTFQNT